MKPQMYRITRTHDFSAGHRVCGHEGQCAHLHGHNYRAHLTCASAHLDSIGRVIDFADVKLRLCHWIDVKWDHKFLVHHADMIAMKLYNIDPAGVVLVPFNPTAENMAQYLVDVVGPLVFDGTDIVLVAVKLEETRKCSAEYGI